MNRRATTLVLLLIVIVVGAALLLVLTSGSSPTNTCHAAHGTTHTITISGSVARPANITGRLCDSLQFINRDHVTREIAFGPHEHHVAYDGVAEHFLNQGRSFSVTLNMSGTYYWHDHLHDDIKGTFVVSR